MSESKAAVEPVYVWSATRNLTRPKLHDETLRDGLQNPTALDPTVDQKIEIVHLLDEIGIDSVNIGLPAAGPRPYADCIAIARAMAVNPAVLLMDEPLSALDSQTRELLMDDLVGLWERAPFTAVYVTHNLHEAVRLGHRIVVLSRRPGQIREIVEIDKPLGERQFGDADLDKHQKHLWDLMREEARAADAELINA